MRGRMLSKRIIGVILLRDGRAVKSRQFKDYRDVGNPVSQARIFYSNGIDELCLLNTQSEKGIQPLLDVLPQIGNQCFIPIAAGGGVKSVDDAAHLIAHGAEKVVVRTAIDAIPAIAARFGRQAVVQCCDFSYEKGIMPTPLSKDAGELLLQSVDHDGMMGGYCMDLLPEDGAPYEADVPMVMLGGCGNFQHMLDAFNAGVDACAAGSLFAFTDSNPIRAKKWLRNHGVSTRA